MAIDSIKNESGWMIKKYPVSLVEPDEWKVGNNKFEITIHNMASYWSFPYILDFSVEITPEMFDLSAGITNLMDANYHEHLDWGHVPRPGILSFTGWYTEV